jgi:hypothetical protein
LTIFTLKGRKYWHDSDDEKTVRVDACCMAVDQGALPAQVVIVKSGVSMDEAREFVYGYSTPFKRLTEN